MRLSLLGFTLATLVNGFVATTATAGPRAAAGAEAPAPLPEFVLQDLNPSSLTRGLPVAVADQRGRVSAWYFGHST